MPDDERARVERLLADHPTERRAIERTLLGLVLDALPDAIIQVDEHDGLIALGTGPRMRDVLFAIVPHTAHVNLQLADGVDLPDPAGILEGSGKRVRHVKVRSVDDLELLRGPIGELVDAQVAVRRQLTSAAPR
jgi:hypothetical protein